MGRFMPSLQIRGLPEPLHQLLQRRARAHKRSLSQQALYEFEQVAGGAPRQRRISPLARIAEHWRNRPSVTWPEAPEDLIRSDC